MPQPSSALLTAVDLTRSYGDRTVLAGVSLAVDPGHRTGLVGENGVGKSTLLRLLAGVEDPDSGTVTRPPDLGYLHQELPYGPTTSVGQVVEEALAGVREVERDLEAAALALAGPSSADVSERASAIGHARSDNPHDVDALTAAYDLALARAEQSDVWGADARAARALAGLGLDVIHRDRLVSRLSGGQRTRLGLAALLIRQPGALLLDEPTNHLDDEAAEFLASALRALPGAVLLASHDRVFLDEVCTEILDLDPSQEASSAGRSGGTLYAGSYRDYLRAKRVERARWEQRFAAEQDELKALRRSVATTARNVSHDRERGNQSKLLYDAKGERVQSQVSRRVRNAQQRLDTLQAEQVRRPPEPLRFAPPHLVRERATGSSPGRSGGRRGSQGASNGTGGLVLWARDVVVQGGATEPGPAAPGRPRLDLRAAGVPSIDLAPGAKLLVTGANGSGKSTLLHVLAGDLAPSSGTVGRARGVEVALLEQDVRLHDDARTPRDLLALVTGQDPADRPHVNAHGLVAPRDLDRPLGVLSVGQRRRVVLAMLVTQAPDVLLLDEPTNHVSLTLAEELMAAVETWPGAVVVASHDRWLRRTWKGDVVHLG
ncbi:ABC-F family ATP-binding cassette domain-containing protein [Oerskovia turbata]|uniref:ABC-F family ATP-binding cassette domain-containing protein n=1 Tax=Oerskovia turbata TaxID=1713 RepID=A0A4Q1KR26_9CELL|nr:ABC-F family ATP-binding cassette domain-containing protein [Oerskovia turbata]RXR22729.1 ABC-F family ATP-binding cassette domain-containing protein [Oerskovia turbata]RXR32065.1 ABC-F family ATP-binding cassette domain-containing protein [Oerskovia turbata]